MWVRKGIVNKGKGNINRTSNIKICKRYGFLYIDLSLSGDKSILGKPFFYNIFIFIEVLFNRLRYVL